MTAVRLSEVGGMMIICFYSVIYLCIMYKYHSWNLFKYVRQHGCGSKYTLGFYVVAISDNL